MKSINAVIIVQVIFTCKALASAEIPICAPPVPICPFMLRGTCEFVAGKPMWRCTPISHPVSHLYPANPRAHVPPETKQWWPGVGQNLPGSPYTPVYWVFYPESQWVALVAVPGNGNAVDYNMYYPAVL